MTAPTPEQVIHDLHVGFPETRRSALIQEAIDALAAVTAERDQALYEKNELLEAWRSAGLISGQLRKQRDQARQMLADAPHDQSCVANVWTDDEQPFDARPCNCWKSGL